MISGQIMELHHSKHHATYVANLNKALEQYAEAEAKKDLQKMIALQSAINFNGGGACVYVLAGVQRSGWVEEDCVAVLQLCVYAPAVRRQLCEGNSPTHD